MEMCNSNSLTQPENTGVRNMIHILNEQTHMTLIPKWHGMTQGCSFLWFSFFSWMCSRSRKALRVSQSSGAQGPRVLPSSLASPSGRAGVVVTGSRRRPPPVLAAGPSLSGEPSGSWRCGAADRHGGPGAAGSPCWGWGPWEEADRQSNTHPLSKMKRETKRSLNPSSDQGLSNHSLATMYSRSAELWISPHGEVVCMGM